MDSKDKKISPIVIVIIAFLVFSIGGISLIEKEVSFGNILVTVVFFLTLIGIAFYWITTVIALLDRIKDPQIYKYHNLGIWPIFLYGEIAAIEFYKKVYPFINATNKKEFDAHRIFSNTDFSTEKKEAFNKLVDDLIEKGNPEMPESWADKEKLEIIKNDFMNGKYDHLIEEKDQMISDPSVSKLETDIKDLQRKIREERNDHG
ncbi:hypothetical protein KKB18_02615 [bacterium]|nr:hypothetical protein [bacterium]